METSDQSNQNIQTPPVSAIARLIEQWDAEAEATRLAMQGYAITARHDFITKRMQSFRDEKIIEMMTLEAQKEVLKVKEAQNNAASHENSMRGEDQSL